MQQTQVQEVPSRAQALVDELNARWKGREACDEGPGSDRPDRSLSPAAVWPPSLRIEFTMGGRRGVWEREWDLGYLIDNRTKREGPLLDASWPNLIDQETWDRVQWQRQQRHGGGGGRKPTSELRAYVFQGLLRCVKCDRRMHCHPMRDLIAHLKREYGAGRSRLKGATGARIWAGWAALAYNLDTVARLPIKTSTPST
jgi:hypothetical protein